MFPDVLIPLLRLSLNSMRVARLVSLLHRALGSFIVLSHLLLHSDFLLIASPHVYLSFHFVMRTIFKKPQLFT